MKSFLYKTAVFLMLCGAALLILSAATTNPSPELARLERIMAVLEKHPRYLWKVRANLDTDFEGAGVITDEYGFRLTGAETKSSEVPMRQVAVFGASPTFGYGVKAADTYSKVAQRLLTTTQPGIHVKNLGQIGYSSFQGRRLFEDYLEKNKPALVTVSYVVNDIDRLRFYYSNGTDDPSTDPPSEFGAGLYNTLNDFGPTEWFFKRQRRLLVKIFSGVSHKGGYDLSHVRVTRDVYRGNLEWFADYCSRENLPLIFVKMPFRLPNPPGPVPEGLTGRLDDAQSKLENGDAAGALIAAEAALADDKWSSRAMYIKGRALESLDKKDQAETIFREAVKSLIYDCERDASVYNGIMNDVAEEKGVPLVDAADGLGSGAGAHMELFVKNDYIHPNKKGHEIIGRCLADGIQKRMDGDDSSFNILCGQSTDSEPSM